MLEFCLCFVCVHFSCSPLRLQEAVSKGEFVSLVEFRGSAMSQKNPRKKEDSSAKGKQRKKKDLEEIITPDPEEITPDPEETTPVQKEDEEEEEEEDQERGQLNMEQEEEELLFSEEDDESVIAEITPDKSSGGTFVKQGMGGSQHKRTQLEGEFGDQAPHQKMQRWEHPKHLRVKPIGKCATLKEFDKWCASAFHQLDACHCPPQNSLEIAIVSIDDADAITHFGTVKKQIVDLISFQREMSKMFLSEDRALACVNELRVISQQNETTVVQHNVKFNALRKECLTAGVELSETTWVKLYQSSLLVKIANAVDWSKVETLMEGMA